MLPFGKMAQTVEYQDIQAATQEPAQSAELMEQLNGAFFIGGPSTQGEQDFEISGVIRTMTSIRLGWRFGRQFELQAGVQHFKTNWSGHFPVTVLPQQLEGPPMAPHTLQGAFSATTSGILTETDLAYFFACERVRPFVKVGLRGQFNASAERKAEVAGVVLPMKSNLGSRGFSPFGGAGVRVGFLKNGFVEAGVSYGKAGSKEYAGAVDLGVGGRF
jgi:hypothetical protein